MSVTGGVHFDLVKRVLRDIQRAGQEPEEIIHQISETVSYSYSCLDIYIESSVSSNLFLKITVLLFPYKLHIFSS